MKKYAKEELDEDEYNEIMRETDPVINKYDDALEEY